MDQSRLWSTFALVALGVLGCVSKTVELPASEPSPAERIAFFGHGKLFDAAMNEIKLDDALLKQMQDSMLLEIEQFKGRDPGSEDKAVLAQAQQLLKSQGLAANEAVLLKSGVIHTLLRSAPRELRDKYEWRNTAIFYRYWNQDLKLRVLSDRILELVRNLHLFDPANQGTATTYMNDCRAHGVPVPPDWAETGTAWRKQGTLEHQPAGTGVVCRGVDLQRPRHQRRVRRVAARQRRSRNACGNHLPERDHRPRLLLGQPAAQCPGQRAGMERPAPRHRRSR